MAAGIDGYQGDDDDDDDDDDDEDNRFAVKAKYVTPLNNGQSLNLEADGAFGDTDTVMLGADYYFNPAFSLGAEYSIQDNGDDDADFFALRTKYFINSDFAVGGAIGFGDNVNLFNINASFRF
ncbi:putative porin [Acinetobacter pragensis]|uniref:putative porin n=1 Tax=Acinetobacter pragensis TaxID=1806892 RepID=UPI000A637534|nr:putative porin [Acinetobacter pragensis]